MQRTHSGIIRHNMPVFYVVDALRALWFITSIWVAYEKQYLTLSQITFVEAILLTVTLLMQLPTGAFADLFGKRKAMITGFVLYFCAMVAYAYANTLTLFLLYAVFAGMAEAFIDGTREALLYDTLKQDGEEEHFSVTASKLSMVFQVSLAIATVIGGWIGLYSYVWTIRITAVMFLLSLVNSFRFQEPAIDTEKFTLRNYLAKTKQGMKEVVKNPFIKKLSAFYIMIGSLTWVPVISLNMLHLNDFHFSPIEIGIAIGAGRIVNSVVLFGLLKKSRFFTRKRTFILLPIILIVSYVPAVFVSKWFAVIPVVGSMFVSSARWNILSRYTNAEFDSKSRATAISTLCMAIGIIYVIIMSFAGAIMERFGGSKTIFTGMGLLALMFALPLGMHLSKHHAD